MKVILVGASGVGKTSLLSALLKQKFDRRTSPTVAPAFATTQLTLPGGRIVDLQIWDTAGQEQYQAISQMFYRDSDFAFICYNAREDDGIESWIKRVRDHVPNCSFFLVLTKSDLLSPEELVERTNRGIELGAGFQCKHFLTSAQTGDGVEQLFQAAARDYDALDVPGKTETKQMELTGDSPEKKGCC
jgi:small GTP-binding protein